MATLGSGNDNQNIDGAITSFIDFGGSDTYTIIPSLSANVTITDNQASTINLPAGMDISAASFSANGVQFTVNGFTVTFIGNPSLFTFVFGGTPLDPNLGTKKTFAETATAFGTTIPAPGDDPNVATQTGPVDAGGTVGQTLAISASANSVDEGASVNVSVTGAAANSTVAYTISGVDAADVDALTGTITTDANGAGSATIAAIADKATEGPETMKVTLDGTTVATDVIINDTSIAPTSSLTVTAAAASVNEGDTAVFNIATTNVAEGTTVSYVIGGNVSDSAGAGDITGPLTGTATIGADGKATISVAVTSDNVTEGSETLTLTAAAGQLSDTANTIINDTSTSPSALTTADDTITGGAGDDSYTGVSSALSSERTLNPNDKIDGGAGNDTLSVDMKGAFGGFSSTGFLKNVENVNLTNTGTITREFDASGATGVQTYKLTGNVNLRDLDSVAGVTVENRDQTALNIAYANADVVKGTSDTLALGLNNVGTAAVAASGSTPAVTAKYVGVTATGIETVAITSTGTNLVDLTNVGTKAITAAGSGNLDIMAVNAGVKTFDGSAATGNTLVDFANASGVTSVKGGSGVDQFKATVGDLVVNATVDGGSGSDALALANGNLGTLQLAMTGVETIGLSGVTGLIYSGTNTSGVEKISSSGTNTATFANFGGSDLAFDLKGTSGASTISADQSGKATINVTTPDSKATNTAPTTNTTSVTVSKAGQVALTVDDKMDYEGVITASEATAATAAIKGQTSGAAEIVAGKAQSIVISEVTGANSALKVTAGAATSVQVSNAKNLDLTGSTLSKVETFSSNGAGDIKTGDLGAANQVTIENAGKATVGAVGSATQDYSANVTVSGSGETKIGDVKTNSQAITIVGNNLTGKAEIGNLDAKTGDVNVTVKTTGAANIAGANGKNVTVDFGGVLGDVTAAGISATTAAVTGSTIAKNTMTISADTLTATGGIVDDILTLSGNSAGTASKVTNTLNVTTDLGNDTVNYTTNTATGLTTTLTGKVDLGGGTDTFTVSVGGTDAGSVNAAGLTVSGAETFTITGNIGANTLVGTAGKDTIDLGDDAVEDVTAALAGVDTIDMGTDTGGQASDEVHFRSIDGEALVVGTSTGDKVSNFDLVDAAMSDDQIVFLDNGNFTGGSVNFSNSADTTAGAKGTTINAADIQFIVTDGKTVAQKIAAIDIANASGNDTAGNGADDDVLVFQGTTDFFTEQQIADATFNAQNTYLVSESAAGVFSIYFDADWTSTADRFEIGTITTVGGGSLDINNFEVYTTL